MKKILFIDRDGTLIVEPDDKQVDRLEKVRFANNVVPTLLALRDTGYEFVLVSNQDGRGTPSFPEADFSASHEFVMDTLRSQGIAFLAEFVCPHFEKDQCDCRKPKTGLLTRFLVDHTLDTENSYVIGDRQADLDLANNLGLQSIRIDLDQGGWADVALTLRPTARVGIAQRTSKETDIQVRVDLDDAESKLSVSTGIGFFDHMLEQLAKHGGFCLSLHCQGDLHIDEHHTVEDCALTLGTAMRQALGNKLGLSRYGFVLPMDETEVQVSLDLSARPLFKFDGEFSRDQVGELSTEMVPHFFKSLCDTLGATMHITMRGENSHHQVEGIFKCVGRALRQAILVSGKQLPSTKGML